MRLQVGPLAALLLWPSIAASEGRAASLVSFYAASDRLTVLSPQVSLRVPVKGNVDVEAGYEADIITSASVDVMTSASPRGYSEERHGMTAGVSYRPAAGAAVGLRYMPSFEPDYRSHTASGGLQLEWIDRRLLTELGYRLGLDLVGRHGEPIERWRDLRTHSLTAGVGWVFSPTLVGDISYELSFMAGFMASPYRYVRMNASAPPDAGVSEQTPDERKRHAVAARLKKALPGGYFVTVSYRIYTDSWGLLSHTESASLERAFGGDRLIVGLSARVYGQSAASFYERRYQVVGGELPRYRTADKMLSPQWSLLAGPRADMSLGRAGPVDDLRLSGRAELYEQRFTDFAPLSARHSVVLSIGLGGDL